MFSTPVELDVEANKAGKWVYKNKYMIASTQDANIAIYVATGCPGIGTVIAGGALIGGYALGYLFETAIINAGGSEEKPFGGYGAECVETPSGQIVYKSEGVIEVSADGATTVYVFNGTFELSDLDQNKIVSVYSGQTSTITSQCLPSEPEPFDPNSIDRWWETEPGTAPTPTTQPPKSTDAYLEIIDDTCAGYAVYICRWCVSIHRG